MTCSDYLIINCCETLPMDAKSNEIHTLYWTNRTPWWPTLVLLYSTQLNWSIYCYTQCTCLIKKRPHTSSVLHCFLQQVHGFRSSPLPLFGLPPLGLDLTLVAAKVAEGTRVTMAAAVFSQREKRARNAGATCMLQVLSGEVASMDSGLGGAGTSSTLTSVLDTGNGVGSGQAACVKLTSKCLKPSVLSCMPTMSSRGSKGMNSTHAESGLPASLVSMVWCTLRSTPTVIGV